MCCPQESTDLVGNVLMSKILRPSIEARNYGHKTVRKIRRLQVPEYMVQGEWDPQYLDGAGYVIPAGAMKCLYKEGLSTPYMHINDAWISGYVREKCGYRVKHFNSLKPMKPPMFPSLGFVNHYVHNMMELYEKYENSKTSLL